MSIRRIQKIESKRRDTAGRAPQITVRIDPDVWSQFREIVAQQGISGAEALRGFITQTVNEVRAA